MTFTPTEERQQDWVKKHLNGGVCPPNREAWRNLRDQWRLACFESLDWLSESDITTLEEAWDQCSEPAWLLWTLRWMEPDEADQKKCLRFWKWYVTDACQRPILTYNHLKLLPRNDAIKVAARWLQISMECEVNDVRREEVVKKIKELWPNPWRMP